MAIPPLLSSTPPPLDNYGESEDDEFGDFTAAGIDGKLNLSTLLILYFFFHQPKLLLIIS